MKKKVNEEKVTRLLAYDCASDPLILKYFWHMGWC